MANEWVNWVVALFGLWVLISPFVIDTPWPSTSMYSNVIAGIVVLVLGAWMAYSSRSAM